MNDLKTDLPSKVVFLKTGVWWRDGGGGSSRDDRRRGDRHLPPSPVVGGFVRSNGGLKFRNLPDGHVVPLPVSLSIPANKILKKKTLNALETGRNRDIIFPSQFPIHRFGIKKIRSRAIVN